MEVEKLEVLETVKIADYVIAKKRGKRAEKLFSREETMGRVIAACSQADSGDEEGGKTAFRNACREVMNASDEGLSEGDFIAFLDDMWEAAKTARRRVQEAKPCW